MEQTRPSRTFPHKPINTKPITDLENLDTSKDYCYISAEDAFLLRATHGLDIETMCDLAHERGLLVDVAGFLRLEEEHSQKSRVANASKGKFQGLAGVGKGL